MIINGWVAMRLLLAMSLIASLFVGCSTVPHELHAVWKERSPPTPDLAAPPGFRVTPWNAYRVICGLSPDNQRRVWFIYADSSSYYFLDVDSAVRVSKRLAYDEGLIIDGRTGVFVDRAVLDQTPTQLGHFTRRRDDAAVTNLESAERRE